MTRLHEELISRYVDGDLNAAEAAQARLLIETDPGVRAIFDQYSSLSQSLAELPRHEIPVDMVSRLEPYLGRRMPLWRDLLTVNHWLVGAAAVASISGLAGLLLLQQNVPSETAQVTRGKMFTSTLNDASDPPVAADEAAPKAEVATVKSPVAKALELIQPKSEAAAARNSRSSGSPVEAFVKQLAGVDRRHSIRLHVDAANSRVENDVVTALARFRGEGTELMRVGPVAKGEPPSLRFVALVSTRSVQGLIGQLARQFSNRMELDLPEDIDWLREHQAQLQPVGVAGANLEEGSIGANEHTTGHNPLKAEKFGPIADPVPDALARPLEAAVADTVPGTLDEVMIQIRTDLLVPEPKKSSSSKTRNRPLPDSRK